MSGKEWQDMAEEFFSEEENEKSGEPGRNDQQELTPAQLKFVQAMIESKTIHEAAKQARISERTAYRYMSLPLVKEAINHARTEIFESSMAELKNASKQAIDTLIKHLTDDETPPNAQIRAAQIILEQGIQVHKVDTFERMLEDYEAKARGLNGIN